MNMENYPSTKQCSSCQEKVSFSAAKCPYCGKNFRNWFIRHPILSILIGLFIFSNIVGGLSPLFYVSKVPVQTKQENTQNTIEKYFTKEEVLEARKLFSVEVINSDTSQCYGEISNCADYVRLKISNASKITLPYLTVKTIRYDKNGKVIGFSRAPSIPTSNIKSGESLIYDYYPLGHFNPLIAETKEVEVEIEHIINKESEKFFNELNEKIPKQ